MIRTVNATITKKKMETLKLENPEKWADAPDDGYSFEIKFEVGDNALEAIELFEDAPVFSQFCHAVGVAIANRARPLMENGLNQAEVQAAFYDPGSGEYAWKPGVAAERMTEADKYAAKVNRLGAEDKAAAIAELLKKLGVKSAKK